MPSGSPYLSIVVASRNDDHGGNLLRRMQTFLNGLIGQCQRHHLDAELIVVEWNPPADRPRLAQVLRWPADPRPCRVRILEVPPHVHRRFRHAQRLPLLQMIAKNVGIRRARGRFILATNIDILFSEELMAFLASRQLESGRMYRLDRYDVAAEVPGEASVEDQLAYCRHNLLRVNTRDGVFPLTPDGHRCLFAEDILSPEQGLLPGAGWYPVEVSNDGLFRWVADRAELIVVGTPGQWLVLDLEPGPSVRYRPFTLEVRTEAGEVVARSQVEDRGPVRLPIPAGRRFFLHVSSGTTPTPHDPRTLAFRAFGSGAPARSGTLAMRDIAPADSGIRFGPGWHAPERDRWGFFRWAGKEAVLHIDTADNNPDLLILPMEPGPGVGWQPFTLAVDDARGRPVIRCRVDGFRPVMLRLPLADRGPQRFTLRAAEGGRMLATDARILNFRVFAPLQWGRSSWRMYARCWQNRLRRWLPAARSTKPGEVQPIVQPLPLHLGAAGDFTLMAREHWWAVRGYPEFEGFPLHIDSLLCYAAHHAGARETILQDPMRVYHIEHALGTSWTGTGTAPVLERLQTQGIPCLDAGQVLRWATQMRQEDRPLLFNRQDWGLAALSVQETPVTAIRQADAMPPPSAHVG